MPTTSLMPTPKQQYFDSPNGRPLVGGKIYTYAAGTSTPKATYTNSAGTIQQANPIILNSRGEPDNAIYWNGSYKVDVCDADDNLVYSVDNYVANPAGKLADDLALSTGAGLIGFSHANSYSAGTVGARLGLLISVKDAPYNAAGNGATDDYAAIQAALNACPPYGTVWLPPGTYVISSTLTVPSNNIRIVGPAKILAKTGVSFEFMLSATSKTGVVVEQIEFDANKSGRSGAQAHRFMGAAFLTCTDCAFINCTARNCRGYGGISAVGLGIAGGSTRGKIQNCTLIDCGDSGHDSDGVFTSGDQNVISNSIASNCTDTGFVIESSNNSIISGCTAINCSAPAAITNASGDDKRGNTINGLTGTCNLQGSTGQIQIGIPGSTAGHLYDTEVTNVSLYMAAGTTGTGPAINVRQGGSGRAKGVTMSGIRINGSKAQGILVDGDDVDITDTRIQGITDACIQYQTGSNGYVSQCRLTGGTFGIASIGTAVVDSNNNVCKSQSQYGLIAAGTSTLTSTFDTVRSAGVASSFKDVGATLDMVGFNDVGMAWQSWTPTYSTDIGNAAASFSGGTVTTNLARIRRQGKTAFVTIDFSSTLLAITPGNIQLTLPAGFPPANSTTRNPATVTDGSTIETGFVRTLTGSDKLAVYRAAGAAYTSAAAVQGQLSFSYEIA